MALSAVKGGDGDGEPVDGQTVTGGDKMDEEVSNLYNLYQPASQSIPLPCKIINLFLPCKTDSDSDFQSALLAMGLF